jgi:hypothetical protein
MPFPNLVKDKKINRTLLVLSDPKVLLSFEYEYYKKTYFYADFKSEKLIFKMLRGKIILPETLANSNRSKKKTLLLNTLWSLYFL